MDAASLVDTLNINTVGAYRMMQQALPRMHKRGYGRIVNVSSGLGGLQEMGGGFFRDGNAVPW